MSDNHSASNLERVLAREAVNEDEKSDSENENIEELAAAAANDGVTDDVLMGRSSESDFVEATAPDFELDPKTFLEPSLYTRSKETVMTQKHGDSKVSAEMRNAPTRPDDTNDAAWAGTTRVENDEKFEIVRDGQAHTFESSLAQHLPPSIGHRPVFNAPVQFYQDGTHTHNHIHHHIHHHYPGHGGTGGGHNPFEIRLGAVEQRLEEVLNTIKTLLEQRGSSAEASNEQDLKKKIDELSECIKELNERVGHIEEDSYSNASRVQNMKNEAEKFEKSISDHLKAIDEQMRRLELGDSSAEASYVQDLRKDINELSECIKKLNERLGHLEQGLSSEISNILQELTLNKSAPLSKGQYVESGSRSIDLMGCKVQFENNALQKTELAYVGVRPISDNVPDEGCAISPEVECWLTKSCDKNQVNITLPLHALSSDKKVKVRGKVNGSTGWVLIEELPVKGRKVQLSLPSFTSIKILVTCSQIKTGYLCHFLFFKLPLLCNVLCLENEALIARISDIFERRNFGKTSCFSFTVKPGEQVKYQYKCTSSTVPIIPDEEVVLDCDEFFKDPVYSRPITLELSQYRKQEVLKLTMSMSSPRKKEETLELKPTKHVPGEMRLIPYVNIRRCPMNFYKENLFTQERCVEAKYSPNLEQIKIYPVYQGRPKGMALIINNERKGKKGWREGSRVDMVNQVALWRDLGFEVVPKIDLSAEKVLDECRKFANKANEKCTSIVVVVIMSHGATADGKQILQGEDGAAISLDRVVALFTEKSLCNLDGIPKLFMLQACRRDIETTSENCPNLEQLFGRSREEPDVVIAYCCQIGSVSKRDHNKGSRAMNAVTEVFMRLAHDTQVRDMLDKVNEIVSMKAEQFQISVQKSQMRGKLYLFPGWPAN